MERKVESLQTQANEKMGAIQPHDSNKEKRPNSREESPSKIGKMASTMVGKKKFMEPELGWRKKEVGRMTTSNFEAIPRDHMYETFVRKNNEVPNCCSYRIKF